MNTVASTRLRSLRDIADIDAGPSGSLLDKLSDAPHGIPVVSPADITDHHAVDTRKLRRVPHHAAAKLNRFRLQEGDILVVRQGSLGRLALLQDVPGTWFYNSSCLRIRLRESVVPAYLLAYLAHPTTQSGLLDRVLPGTVPSVNSAILGELSVVVPPVADQLEFVATAAAIDQQTHAYRAIANRLDTLRAAIFEDRFLARELS